MLVELTTVQVEKIEDMLEGAFSHVPTDILD